MRDDITQTGDNTYTGYVFSVPGVEQIEVVASYSDDPAERVLVEKRAFELAAHLRDLLTN